MVNIYNRQNSQIENYIYIYITKENDNIMHVCSTGRHYEKHLCTDESVKERHWSFFVGLDLRLLT